MTELSRCLVVDTSTGTVLTAHTCVLMHESDLSSSEWNDLDSMSDSEVSQIAKERGRSLADLIP